MVFIEANKNNFLEGESPTSSCCFLLNLRLWLGCKPKIRVKEIMRNICSVKSLSLLYPCHVTFIVTRCCDIRSIDQFCMNLITKLTS